MIRYQGRKFRKRMEEEELNELIKESFGRSGFNDLIQSHVLSELLYSLINIDMSLLISIDVEFSWIKNAGWTNRIECPKSKKGVFEVGLRSTFTIAFNFAS